MSHSTGVMDFVKCCKTGVQAIDGYAFIPYQIYQIKRENTSQDTDTALQPQDVEIIEASLRQEGYLVAAIPAKRIIWVFQEGGLEGSSQEPRERPVPPRVDGYILLLITQSVLRAAELGQVLARNCVTNPSTPASPSPLGPNAKTAQAANFRAVQQNAQGTGNVSNPPQPIPPNAVYAFFISSVVASLCYKLARQYHLTPINYRTLVYSGSTDEDLDWYGRTADEGSVSLLTLGIHLTTQGTLVVSTALHSEPMYQLEAIPHSHILDNGNSVLLRVAPNGMLARLGSKRSEAGVDTDSTKDGISTVAQNEAAWKTLVRQWLERKGIFLKDLDRTRTWIWIHLSEKHEVGIGKRLHSGAHQLKDILWPSSLCYYSSPVLLETATALNPQDHGGFYLDSAWYRASQQSTVDPFQAAQEWFLGATDRAKAIESRKKPKKEEDAALSTQLDVGGIYPSSPFYSRNIGPYDTQAASGVYPTPPDGLLSQGPGLGSMMDVPSVPYIDTQSAQPSAFQDAKSVDHMEVELAHSAQGSQTFRNAHSSKSTQDEADMNLDVNMADDELFNDMDEEVFGAQDLTDADFNFFDEPDMDDDGEHQGELEMGDFSDQAAVKSNSVPPEEKCEPDLHLPVDVQVPDSQPNSEPSGSAEAIQSNAVDAEVLATDTDESGAKAKGTGQAQLQADDPAPRPPLSPKSIQRTLFSFPKPNNPVRKVNFAAYDGPRKAHADFLPVQFSSIVAKSDAKYTDAGLFGYINSRNELKVRGGAKPKQPPDYEIRLPKKPKRKHHHRHSSSGDHLSNAKNAQPSALYSAHLPEADSSEDSDDSEMSDGSSMTSEELITTSPAVTPLPIGNIGKEHWQDGETASSAVSPEDIVMGDMQDTQFITKLTEEQMYSILSLFEPDRADWSLAGFPPPVELPLKRAQRSSGVTSPLGSQSIYGMSPGIPSSSLPSDKDIIGIAQILADQVSISTLDLLHEQNSILALPSSHTPMAEISPHNATQTFENAVKDIFSTASSCDLMKYAMIADGPADLPPPPQSVKFPPRSVPRRNSVLGAMASDKAGSNHIFPIPPPHVRIRRADALWDMFPPAITFWDTLGLAPASGPKNVMTFCIFPGIRELWAPVVTFLDCLQSTYESCKLGTHVRGASLGSWTDGLVPVDFNDQTDSEREEQPLATMSAQLGKALASFDFRVKDKQRQDVVAPRADDTAQIDSFVIYMVNPSEHVEALREICAAFWTLYHAYGEASRKPGSSMKRPDVVLQVLPIKYIASKTAPVVPDSTMLMKLVREVYDRCPPSVPNDDKSPLRIYNGPSIQLEERLPKVIQFKLVAEPPSDLLHDFSYLHVGYARSLTGEWVTAVWGDNTGKYSACVSYSVHSGRSFAEVAREIWQTSLEIMQDRRVTWRMCIARAGVIDREEEQSWISLASAQSHLTIGTVLVSIDTAPPLTLTPTPTTSSTDRLNLSFATPVSTPGPGVSPDSTLAQTPTATLADPPVDLSTETDAVLIDLADETYGVVLAHRLSHSHSIIEYRPALASGLLVRRGTAERPNVIGVSVVWVGNSGRGSAATGGDVGVGFVVGGGRGSVEGVLRELLLGYRGLGLLGRVRGVGNGLLPVHVGGAIRGVKGLTVCGL